MEIIRCGEWGAVPVDTSKLARTRALGIVIHHTASLNLDPLEDPAVERDRVFRLARSIQQAHQKWRWIDSGQHFTIGRSGIILEGRHGSLAAAKAGKVIRAAHAGEEHANAELYGIECEGLYQTEPVPEALWKSLVELCSWLSFWGRFQSQKIHPHRRFRATICPGDVLVGRIEELRSRVHDRKFWIIKAAQVDPG